MVAVTVAPALAQDPRSEAEASRRLSRIKSTIESLQRELEAEGAERERVVRALEEHERAIAAIAREQRRLESTERSLVEALDHLRESAGALRERTAELRAGLARQLRVAFALGREDRLKLLLNAERADALARVLRYHDYVTRERRRRISALRAAVTRLDEAERRVAAESRRLVALRARQTEKRESLLVERARRAEVLAEIESRLEDRRQRLDALERDRRKLSTLVERLRRAIDDIPPELEPPRSFAALRGRLPWPVQGQLARRFGAPREDADLDWQGVLLEAPSGREVRAVSHGRVVFADWLRGFGLMVILDHGDGYMSLYGQNQTLLREPGEWVAAGDPLATVGDSGGHSRSALYFEIRHDGKPQDPAAWCDRRARFRASL